MRWIACLAMFWGLVFAETAAPKICRQRKSCLNRIFSGFRGPLDVELMFRALTVSEAQIVWLGEWHAVAAGDVGYLAIYHALRAAGFDFDCVFVERDASSQPEIDAALRSCASSDEPAECVTAPLLRRPFFLDLIAHRGESERGLSVFAVDDSEGFLLDEKNRAFSDLGGRNARIARRIRAYFAAGTCRKAISIGGIRHLFSGRQRNDLVSPKITVPFRSLRAEVGADLRSVAIGLDSDELTQTGLNWSECRQDPKIPREGRRGFLVDPTEAEFCPFTGKERGGTVLPYESDWNELDAIVVVKPSRAPDPQGPMRDRSSSN